MDRDPWELQTLAHRIAMVDPSDHCSPAVETSAKLTQLHRELAEALGPDEARVRFDRALYLAVTGAVAARPSPCTPAA